ncbi:hypothetical protein GGD83_004570 [Rhodoblastus sphagnicola]|uniref:hypothetical protein n=1 Tax=Rhodoblastus sphagnicola TaxID=333368 RepID=UPI001608B70D|nr:hypothetical protein [Rhodoblastus sphagnicola]MBB4200741.1 hypothetical protein [Rhodoblastus sphagnicola]
MLDPEEKLNSANLPPIRISRTLLTAVKLKARRRDETVSQVVRRALTAYVADAPQADLFDHAAATKAKPKSRKAK